MTLARTLALTTTLAAAGLASLTQPASAAASSDLADWQANYGTSASVDGDGDVDGRDFLVWRRG